MSSNIKDQVIEEYRLIKEYEIPVATGDGAPAGGTYWQRKDPNIKPN